MWGCGHLKQDHAKHKVQRLTQKQGYCVCRNLSSQFGHWKKEGSALSEFCLQGRKSCSIEALKGLGVQLREGNRCIDVITSFPLSPQFEGYCGNYIIHFSSEFIQVVYPPTPLRHTIKRVLHPQSGLLETANNFPMNSGFPVSKINETKSPA